MKTNKHPSLKSASGAGFTFEDKVTAMLLCEMLAGVHSLGTKFGIVQKLERQAGDWEPFGDLLLEVSNSEGKLIRCGGSVKSNRQVNANGCDKELCAGMWATMAKTVFVPQLDFLFLACSPLSAAVSDHLNSLCQQAQTIEANRFDQKVVHEAVRKIYKSFANPGDNTETGLPGHALARLICREFDFERTVSASEITALRLCREALDHEEDEKIAKELWTRLCEIAQELRITGGALLRDGISAKLRPKFHLRDDPCDTSTWTKIRRFSREGLDDIETTLPGNIVLPRTAERNAIQTAMAIRGGCYLLGGSGSGKSALVKVHSAELVKSGTELVWIRADRFNQIKSVVSDLEEVLGRCRHASALMVIDALEGCTTPNSLGALGRLVSGLAGKENSPWTFILTCQTPEWARVNTALVKYLAGQAVITERVECDSLSKEDFDLACATSSTLRRLAHEPKLRRFLSTPKMLDILLSGQLAENRLFAGEADLVEWWWEQQVRGSKVIAEEERVAREVAIRMADELCSELPPDSVAGSEVAANELIRNRVLKRTGDGLLRFEHDLLADWSRVMHLKGLGTQKLQFIQNHTENPPWLRAVRLLSQHLLDRAADFDQWCDILKTCRLTDRPNNDPSAENLQIVDAWVEGIIFSLNPPHVLLQTRAELFDSEGWLLRRLVRRLLIVGTFPDPVIQRRCSRIDVKTAEAAAIRYRLPMLSIWMPIVDFLTSHKQEATNMVAVEIGEMAEMWARTETYVKLDWLELADLAVLNAEEELRREVAGMYRHESRSRSSSDGNDPRVTIYSGGLHAASQSGERVGKIAAKAAGIKPWESGDTVPETDGAWLGEWEERHLMFDSGPYVEMPPTSWAGGPTRRTSDDFLRAWFNASNSIPMYNYSAQLACDITLAFLLDWPRRLVREGDHHGLSMDQYGFNFDAHRLYPPFYTKGPFLAYLNREWNSALNLVIHLTNFATERYADWWPYNSKPTIITFSSDIGEVSWFGNHQVYAWSRYNMNTTPVVTCALMALEKWLEDELENGKSILLPVQSIWAEGRSLAFAGLLIALGKRHPELFLNELKPLLFIRDLYLHDMQATRVTAGNGYWPRDGATVNDLRREWENLAGRKTSLNEMTPHWFITRSEFQPVLKEVSATWRSAASNLADDSSVKLPMLRWAAQFDMANWKEVTFPNGEEGWQYEQPEDLRDIQGAQLLMQQQALLTIPYQCSVMLDKRSVLSSEQFTAIWEQLHNWTNFERRSDNVDEAVELESSLRDHRHARAGLIAVLLCLGGEWLDADYTRRLWIEAELRILLADPPTVNSFTADDIHDDYEGFLARSAIRCWIHSPDNAEWRGAAGGFAAVYRYRTIQRLFEEAFLERGRMPEIFRSLEALVLSFAIVRRQARLESANPQPELIDKWFKKWIPKFAIGRGPKWSDDWAKIEITMPFPPAFVPRHRVGERREWRRRNYGLDMGVLLAAFSVLRPLGDAEDEAERKHWLQVCKEMLSTYLRTLPCKGNDSERDKWPYEMWTADEKILSTVAARLFQCSSEEQRSLWIPILSLPPNAHQHITRFLSEVLMETIRVEPLRVSVLIPMWRSMIEYLYTSPSWTTKLRSKQNEVWKYLFLYGDTVASVRDKDHAPLVLALRDLFKRHVTTMSSDPYDQAEFAHFLVSDSGDQLLVEAFEWLDPIWQEAKPYFWDAAVREGHFENLLQRAWQKYFTAIRQRPDALKAFKIVTLNLASRQVATAITIQQQIADT